MPPDPAARRQRPARRAMWLAAAVSIAVALGSAMARFDMAWQPVVAAAARLWALVMLAPLALFPPHRLENENRQRILEFLDAHPGASIQQVRTHVGVAWGTAVYHLDRLRKQGAVVSHRQGNHHRYWLANAPGARLRRSWSVLQQPTARDIAMAVAAKPGMHQSAICQELDVLAPNASKHLSRLERHGLVAKRRISRFAVYEPTQTLHELLEAEAGRGTTAASLDGPDRSRAHGLGASAAAATDPRGPVEGATAPDARVEGGATGRDRLAHRAPAAPSGAPAGATASAEPTGRAIGTPSADGPTERGGRHAPTHDAPHAGGSDDLLRR